MLSVATGYDPRYLLDQVATGRENYYTGAVAEGEPPGRWWGAGAKALGLSGEVDAQDMTALYSWRLDPRAEGFRDRERWAELQESATLGNGAREYKSAEQLYAGALEREPHASAERRSELWVQAGKDERQNVAFLDLTFSVQKSVTMLHTAFEAQEVKARTAGLEAEAAEWGGLRQAVEDAIWAGNNAMLGYLQEQAGYARVGHHGGAAGRWVDAPGWVVGSFFQHDSREHDPQLHIHNPLFNGQECSDGQWRTLDSRAIHRLKPAAAAVGERMLTEHLMASLGIDVATRPDGKAREATAVTPAEADTFSTRSHHINAAAAELIAQFETERGRDVTGLERDRIRRQATLSTRKAKTSQGETRAEALARVEATLQSEVAGGLARIAHAARAQARANAEQPPAAGRFVASKVTDAAVEAAQAKKARFTRADLFREIDTALPDRLHLTDPGRYVALVDGLVDQAITRLEDADAAGPGEGVEPDALRLRDGRSAYTAPGGRTYATTEHLRSENRLRAATEARDGVALTPAQAAAFVERLRGEGVELGLDQAAAVTGVLTSGARVETLIGPAGTGKSFVVGSLARAWADPTHRTDGEAPRRVFGLATAQVAAEVLRAEGLTASNTAAWLAAQRRLDSAAATGRAPLDADARWRLRRGDVLVVDESSMADTADLAAIHAYADEAGAKMLLVGDPRQLAAIGAGGAMDLVAQAGARYDLTEARRFSAAWERDASLRLRDGDPSVVETYHRHGRLVDAGTREQAEAGAARAWLADTLGGHRSLLVVDSNDAAARVSGHLRDELVRLGRVEPEGQVLRDGTFAGIGDIVQGRRLAWDLAGYEGNRRGPKNREHYRVTAVRDHGALEVVALGAKDPFHPATRQDDANVVGRAQGQEERLVLPPDYVAADLTLGYAVTKHAAEGATVWSCYPVLTGTTDLNGSYVPLSRGTETNTAYVVTVTGPADPAEGGEDRTVHHDPRAVLAGILDTRENADITHQSATAARDDADRWAASVQTAAERFADAAHLAALARTGRHLDRLVVDGLLDPFDRARIAAEDGTAGLTRILRGGEIAGHDPEEVLRAAVAERDFDGVRYVSAVIRDRVAATAVGSEPTGTTWSQWIPADIDSASRAHLAAVAEAADTRTRTLGDQLAAAPPAWALAALGAVPDDAANPEARADWAARAGVIAAHRELRGHADTEVAAARPANVASDEASARRTRTVDAAEVLGSAPSPEQVEAHAAYRVAHRASGLPDHERDALELSDNGHRARVRAWAREQTWGPAYVDNMLAGTRQAQQLARHDAELRRAEADVAPDKQRSQQLRSEADHAASLAELLAGQVDKLEAHAAARGRWLAGTAVTRANAEASARHLHHRGADLHREPDVSADEWLDLDRAARRDDDPHRDITDTDLDRTTEQTERAEPTENGGVADDAPDDHREQPDEVDAVDDRQQVDEADQDDGDDQPPMTETDVADIRDRDAEAAPAPDEDTVHVPDDDEVAAASVRVRDADAEMRNRADVDQQRAAQDRADQLNQWHQHDHAAEPSTAVVTDGD